LAKQKLIISRDVIFNEVDFGQQTEPVEIQPNAEDEAEECKVSSQNLVGQQESRKVRSQHIAASISVQMSQR